MLNDHFPLGTTWTEMRALTAAGDRRFSRQTEALSKRDASRESSRSVELLASVRQAPPESPVAIDGLLDWSSKAVRASYQQRAGYLAYIPGGGFLRRRLAGFLRRGE